MGPETMKKAVVAALEDIKARDIAVMNVKKLTSMTDYMVVASGDSNRQTRALSDNVQKKLKELGAQVLGVEGEETGEWVLVDLGAVVVHIMQPKVREYYNLEQLWGGPATSSKPKSTESAPHP